MVHSITLSHGYTAKFLILLGDGMGVIITVEDFDSALKVSDQYLDSFCILDVRLDESDVSAALRRFTDVLSKRVK
jgi:hypothetical protein